jgi:pimeloyl-ACP methyl ester carboxylesterase
MAMRQSAAALLLGCCVAFASPAHADEVKLTRNDLTLNAALTVAPGKRLQDGAVLLVHGLLASDDMEIIQNLQKLLAARGFSSLAPTLSLGIDDRHGMYDCSVPQRHTEADADGEIGAWLGWLKDHGAPHVVLAGHSNGATEVARYAAAHDDPTITALVLVAPRTWTEGRAAAEYEQAHNMPLATELAYAQALVSSGNNDATLEDVGFLSCDHATVTAASFLSYYGDDRTRDTPSVLPEIDAPVLVVAAGNDQVVRDLPLRMQLLVDNTHVSLVTVAGADHLFHDPYAEEAVTAIAKFLQDRIPR